MLLRSCLGTVNRASNGALIRWLMKVGKMPPIMMHLIHTLHTLQNRFDVPLKCLEIGTTRSFSENHWSTYHIGKTITPKGHLTSVDMLENNLNVAKRVCRDLNNITYVCSDSVKHLKSLKNEKFHFCFLDGANDSEITFQEFQLVSPRMYQGGYIMVDDSAVTLSGKALSNTKSAKKGQKVWSYCRENNIPFEMFMTPFGHSNQMRIEVR